jgi:hypothetical protein
MAQALINDCSGAEPALVDVVESPAPPEPRRLVVKSTIIRRLNEAGLLAAAIQGLNSNLYARERWYAPDWPSIYFDDPEALALLSAIGADVQTIMAPE